MTTMMTKEKKTVNSDETRDITIRIMDYLIVKLEWEPLDEGDPGEWYPWEIQDEIHKLINEGVGVKNDD
jgi:hypothetical protein